MKSSLAPLKMKLQCYAKHRIYLFIESSYLTLYFYLLRISLRHYHISNYAREAYRHSQTVPK
jgi:hypothetical protein